MGGGYLCSHVQATDLQVVAIQHSLGKQSADDLPERLVVTKFADLTFAIVQLHADGDHLISRLSNRSNCKIRIVRKAGQTDSLSQVDHALRVAELVSGLVQLVLLTAASENLGGAEREKSGLVSRW